jgi:hypothetical protein
LVWERSKRREEIGYGLSALGVELKKRRGFKVLSLVAAERYECMMGGINDFRHEMKM